MMGILASVGVMGWALIVFIVFTALLSIAGDRTLLSRWIRNSAIVWSAIYLASFLLGSVPTLRGYVSGLLLFVLFGVIAFDVQTLFQITAIPRYTPPRYEDGDILEGRFIEE